MQLWWDWEGFHSEGMDDRTKRPGSITFLLVAGILLLLCLTGSAIAFAPIIRCPQAHSTIWHQLQKDCPRCRGTLRISLLNKWYWQPAPSKLPEVEGGSATLEPIAQDKTAEQLIEALRSDKVEERDNASRELLKKGSSAVPALRKASAEADIELSGRAKEILDRIGSVNAKAAFDKIEEVIRDAKTLRIRLKSEVSNRASNMSEPETTALSTGMLLLKTGNRLAQEVQIVRGGNTLGFSVISDGMHVVFSRGNASYATAEAPKDLNKRASSVIPIIGAEAPWHIEGGKVLLPDLEKECKFTDFKEEPFEGETKALSFKVVQQKGGSNDEVKVTLWYESDSYTLLRKTVDIKFKGTSKSSSATTTYIEFTLNADIPDEKFKLPEDKK